MRLKFYIAIVLSIAFCIPAYAQNDPYQFSHLDISNGLSNNQINCIYKDANGFMWFGTTSGLNRYDGFKFRVFKHDAADNGSLNDNFVLRVFEGPDKKMWIYTHSGLNVYNAETEKFSNDIGKELKKYNIPTSHLNVIKKDADGNFWFVTQSEGLYFYNSQSRTTVHYSNNSQPPVALYSNNVSDLFIGRDKSVWVIYYNGIIDRLDPVGKKVVQRVSALNKLNNKKEYYSAIVGNDNNLWIHAAGSTIGIFCYDVKNATIKHIGKGPAGSGLNTNVVNGIVQGDDNNLWVATDHGGINLIDMKTGKITYLVNKDDDIRSLRGNCVQIYKDDSGIIWVGTYKQGISYYHKGIIQFPLVRHYSANQSSLPYEDVNCFVEDKNGNLWIGTNGGGLIFYDKSTRKYTQYKHNDDAGSISNNVIVSLCIDHNNRLWVGTYFGGLERMEGGRFVHYKHKDDVPESLSDDRVYSIIEDSTHKLWVGTFSGPLSVYDPVEDNFQHPKQRMSSDYTSMLYSDRQDNIWIGRDKGVDVILKASDNVKHYTNNPEDPNSLVNNDVNSVFQDRNGLYWIATKEGLSILNTRNQKFLNINSGNGLPSSNVSNVLEDNNGLIWVSTANGIASIKLTNNNGQYSYSIKKYDEFDGLQGKEYNAKAALKTRNGYIIFGGGRGFNIFNPSTIHGFNLTSKLMITDFQLFNKSIRVGDTVDGNVILEKSLAETQSVVLNHNENVIGLQFVACDYFNPNKIIYQYKLEGFDKEWFTAEQNVPKATYTNLDAGDYVFKVRASNSNDPNNFSATSLNIKILPPFWKSTSAYILYAILFMGGLFYVRHRGIVQLKQEFAQEQDKIEAERNIAKEREEARRMHELDLMKIKFFTNVSHEFRTPLSLIISPIDNLIKNNEHADQQQQLTMIKRNGKRLLNLVNQLLDFRKMEFKELKLCLSKGDIIPFIKDVCSSFTDLADQNKIDFIFDSEINSLITRFDHDKIERVLFNILSNAFKFTAQGGHISVFVSYCRDGATGDDRLLELKIVDTGIGIAAEKQDKIFERFFQDDLPDGLLNQGSGIGLSISKEFVKMHNGEIYVESEPGNGSCFTIRLPLKIEQEQIVTGPLPQVKLSGNAAVIADVVSLESSKKPVVLLIEDNDDMRFYLKDNLKHIFHIIEAINGKDGWQKALSMHPNLIVSDISMPEMNGIDLCNKIRHDSRTAHIPVILLTALTEDENQLAGTASGANDYITKPFNFEILLSKRNGLLQMQQTLKKTYQKQVDIKVQEIDVVSEDQKFLKNTLACIEANITNPNFSVEELSRQMSLSRVSLYKRLLTLTGKTPVDCIRTIRLKRAVQLLEKSQLSIANVAYEVGFNNPTYFSKVFKEEYGTLPSEYVNEYRKREKELLELTN